MRYYLLRIMSGELLHTSLPLAGVRFRRKLSGGGSLRGYLDPAIAAELVTAEHGDGLPALWPWASWILAEDAAGVLQFGGPLIHATRGESRYTLECGSIMAWLNRQYWLGPRYRGRDIDPLQVVRDLVQRAQASPESNLGIVVDDTSSPLRIGGPSTATVENRHAQFLRDKHTQWLAEYRAAFDDWLRDRMRQWLASHPDADRAWKPVTHGDIAGEVFAAHTHAGGDGQIEVYWQPGEPEFGTGSDLWFDTNNDNVLRWYKPAAGWDTNVPSVLAQTAHGLTRVRARFITSPNQLTVFYQKTFPSTNREGDLFSDIDTGELYRWDATDAKIAQQRNRFTEQYFGDRKTRLLRDAERRWAQEWARKAEAMLSAPVEYTERETVKIGAEINRLATQEPGFDYAEDVRWRDRGAGTVELRIRLGYPRLGTRRPELTFDTAWNLGVEGQLADGDNYATTVIGVGRGQGRDMIGPVTEATPAPLVPRVMTAASHKTVSSADELRRLVRAEATTRAVMTRIERVQLRDTPAAPLGSWSVGDDVFTRVRTDWGTADQWTRIVADEWAPEAAYPAVLQLQPPGASDYS